MNKENINSDISYRLVDVFEIQQENLLYRRQYLKYILILRLLFAILFFIVWAYFNFLVKQDRRLLAGVFNYSFPLEIYIGIYFIITLATFIYLTNLKNSSGEKIFFASSLFDFIALFPFIAHSIFNNGGELVLLLILSSTLLSLLVVSFRQVVALTVIYSILIGCLLVSNSLIDNTNKYLINKLNEIELFNHLLNSLISNWLLLLNPIFFTISAGILVGLIGYLSAKARENKIAKEYNQKIAQQLQQLNNAVIRQMSSGLLLVNHQDIIVNANQTIYELFELTNNQQMPLYLSDLSEDLNEALTKWRYDHDYNLVGINFPSGFFNLTINKLANSKDIVILTLEKAEEIYQRLREKRLASLGRLTAGIAHEIRNPLVSIQNAAELLAEKEDLTDHFLTDKIKQNSQRINNIITDILQIFSNKNPEQEIINLNKSLNIIFNQLKNNDLIFDHKIILEINTEDNISIKFNFSYLQQIIENIIFNSIKHNSEKLLLIKIISRINTKSKQVEIFIQDDGKGIDPKIREDVFEPFFSTKDSTGLGLFVVREMCLVNQAQIFVTDSRIGACFKLVMASYYEKYVI